VLTGCNDTRRLTIVTAAALVMPLAAAFVGHDHLLARNTIAVLPLVLALAGAGLAAATEVLPRPVPVLATGVACVVGLVTVVGVAGDVTLQRDDWRGAARALGRIDAVRVVSAPPGAIVPLRYYLPHVRELSSGEARTAEVDYLAMADRKGRRRSVPPRPAPAVPPTLPGFAPAGHTYAKTFTIMRLRAPAPVAVPPTAARPGLDGARVVVLLVSPP
jgi:hypothetical protein